MRVLSRLKAIYQGIFRLFVLLMSAIIDGAIGFAFVAAFFGGTDMARWVGEVLIRTIRIYAFPCTEY